MSQDIISTKFHDQKIQTIIQQTQQLDDKYPVLLMPLRLETRYMAVDRPVKAGVEYDYNILYDIVKLEYLFERIIPIGEISITEAGDIMDDIEEACEILADRFSSEKSLPYPEDKWWARHISSIGLAEQQFKANINNMSFNNPGEKRKYERLAGRIDESINLIRTLRVSRGTNNDFAETSKLIDELNYLDDTLDNLANRSMTYTRQTKASLFQSIENKFEYLKTKISSIEEKMDKNLLANTTQISRIDEFPDIYSNRIGQVSINLNKINSDYKRNEYIAFFEHEIKPLLNELNITISRDLVPKLEYLKELKTSTARELKYRAVVIRYELEQIISKGFNDYHELRATRVRLYDMLRGFRSRGHDIILGSENDIALLRAEWDRIDSLLEQYVGIISQMEGSDRYEDAGISRSISHVNENYRTDLNGLRQSVPLKEAFIKNNDYLESSKAYMILRSKIQEIGSEAYNVAQKQSLSHDDLTGFYDELIDFEGECSSLVLKTTIIPEKYFKDLHNLYGGFRQSIEIINTKAKDTQGLSQVVDAVNDCVSMIDSSMQGLASDITDERDPFYDDFRKKFIFSLPSETCYELWVRIFPDELFLHSHEKGITSEEYEDTKTFWTDVYNAGGHKEEELASWRVLALKYGVNRAAYLRELLNPDKAQQPAPKPDRPAITIKNELDSTRRHFDNIMDLELNGPDAYNEIQMINASVNDSLNIQMQFSEEHILVLNDLVSSLREVQMQYNNISSRLSEIPVSERSLMADFVIKMSELSDNLETLSEEISQKVPVDNKEDLSYWVNPNLPQEGVEIKEVSWSEAQKTSILPEKFVFLGMQENSFSHLVVGNEVPNPLICGIDPSDTDPSTFEYDSEGNLKVDDNIKWMTDFDEAVEKGMGIIVPLTRESRESKFEKIIVLGIKDQSPGKSRDMLTELLEGHIYSPDGMSLLPIGTPTNITERKTSGYSSEEDEDLAYDKITGGSLFSIMQDEKEITDGQRLVESLGLPVQLFEKIDNVDRRDIYKALLMNRVMWPSTMGYYMEEVMDTVFNIDNQKRARDYFSKYVTGRGFLPALRIGEQPYGILPTTAFSRFKTSANETLSPVSTDIIKNLSASQLESRLQGRFDIRLKDLLNMIREQWMKIVDDSKLNILDFDPKKITSQEHFIHLLGLQPTSIEQYYRYNINSAQRRMSMPSQDKDTTVNFADDDKFGYKNMENIFGEFLKKGYFIDDTYFNAHNIKRIEEARIFRLRYLDDFSQLLGPFVKEKSDDADPTELFRDNQGNTYIDKLLGHTPYHFWQEIYGETASNSLFFLFLRQSLACEYRNLAFEILMEEHIINENTRRRAGTKGTYILPSGNNNEDVALTKWNYLFSLPKFFEQMMKASPFNKFPLAQNPVVNSFWEYLKGREWSMSDYLFEVSKDGSNTNAFSNKHDFSFMNEYRQMMKDLKDIPLSELQRLFAEHLDLCTYRFDAWQLGIANKRLSEQRKAPGGKSGLHLGAFGILENLEPGDERTISDNVPVQLRENDGIKVYTDDDNEGFIHAPSINHAMTAAILRAGYIANEGSGDQSNPMAVNLTSRRVRMALNLLNGIKNGQEAGALLGYQLERGLHEGYTQSGLELDAFIYSLRRKFPLVPEVNESNELDPEEERSLLNVVHGTRLLEAVREKLGGQLNTDKSLYELQILPSNKTMILEALGLDPNMPTNYAKAIFREIDRIADAYDALGDLLLSESVYHITQGNYVRSAAVFEALSEGRVPQEVQIINTPRTGHVLTQRMIQQLKPVNGKSLLPGGGLSENEINANIENAKPVNWKDIDFSIRAFVEPSLNKWLGERIGNPAFIRCYASYEDNDNTVYRTVSIKDLNIQPIDLIYMLNTGGEDSFILNQVVADHVRLAENLGPDKDINLFFKKRDEHLTLQGEDLSAKIITINEIIPLVKSLYEIAGNSRATAADDYVIPGKETTVDNDLRKYDIEELKARYDYLDDYCKSSVSMAKVFYQNKGLDYKDDAGVSGAIYTEAEIVTLRQLLYDFHSLGTPGCIPENGSDTSTESGRELAKKASQAIVMLEKKIAKSDKLVDFPSGSKKDFRIDRYIEAIRELLGKSFNPLPHFTLRNFDELNEVLNQDKDKGLMRNADDYAMAGWMQTVSKVREKVNTMEMVSTMGEIFDIEPSDPVPVQLPFEEVEHSEGHMVKDYWLGLEYPDGYEPGNDKLSLVVFSESDLVEGGQDSRRCGFLVDEWIEIIPNREEDTGITFNYDQPDAEPPQSMLLAVTPVETGQWEWSDIVYAILETMDLYKARLVEPEQIDQSMFTQVLPAIMGEMPAPTKYQGTGKHPGLLKLKDNNTEQN